MVDIFKQPYEPKYINIYYDPYDGSIVEHIESDWDVVCLDDGEGFKWTTAEYFHNHYKSLDGFMEFDPINYTQLIAAGTGISCSSNVIHVNTNGKEKDTGFTMGAMLLLGFICSLWYASTLYT